MGNLSNKLYTRRIFSRKKKEQKRNNDLFDSMCSMGDYFKFYSLKFILLIIIIIIIMNNWGFFLHYIK